MTRYDWNLALRIRSIAKFILVTYAVSAFGMVFDAGHCHDHVGRLGEDHAICEHVHSKNQLAVHSFIHTALLTDQRFLASPCCCVFSGKEEAVLQDHLGRKSGQAGVPELAPAGVAQVSAFLRSVALTAGDKSWEEPRPEERPAQPPRRY